MEIMPGVHRIAQMVSTAYLLVDPNDGLTIIDSGPTRFDQVILNYLAKIEHQPADVKRIILTHRHFDHVGGAARLREATGAPVWAHPLDTPAIIGLEPNRPPKGPIGAVIGATTGVIFPLIPCPVDKSLADGLTFDLGGLGELRVILTPGHTMGHCSLLLPSRRLFILGDALFNATGTPQASFDMVNDDTALARRTAIAIADVDADVLVFGHGNPVLHDGHRALKAAAEKAQRDLHLN